MSFDVELMSDQQLDELLLKPKKIPTWRLVNTQSEREKKRIRQMERHNKQLEAARLYQKKKQRARLLTAWNYSHINRKAAQPAKARRSPKLLTHAII